MIIKRRVKICSETHRKLTVKGEQQASLSWCPKCNEQVRMLSPDAAAVLLEISQRMIFRAIEAGELHFIEMPGVLLCFDSLMTHFGNRAETLVLRSGNTERK